MAAGCWLLAGWLAVWLCLLLLLRRRRRLRLQLRLRVVAVGVGERDYISAAMMEVMQIDTGERQGQSGQSGQLGQSGQSGHRARAIVYAHSLHSKCGAPGHSCALHWLPQQQLLQQLPQLQQAASRGGWRRGHGQSCGRASAASLWERARLALLTAGCDVCGRNGRVGRPTFSNPERQPARLSDPTQPACLTRPRLRQPPPAKHAHACFRRAHQHPRPHQHQHHQHHQHH